MWRPSKLILLCVLGFLWPICALPTFAATIFDNSAHDLLTRFDPGTYEVGDEIMLSGNERYLTTFSFEYWGINSVNAFTFAGDVQARVRFYENTGSPFNGYATPSATSFYDSDWFSVGSPTARNTFVFSAGTELPDGGLLLPMPGTVSNMTWTVQFRGMGSTDSVGVDLYSPPAVGSDYPDYWQNTGGNWTLLTNRVPMDFAAQLFAYSTIPEPSALALSLVGGLAILTLTPRLRPSRQVRSRPFLPSRTGADTPPGSGGGAIQNLTRKTDSHWWLAL